MCTQGRVDTKALYELTGQSELGQINSESTIVHDIHFDPTSRQLHINFEAIVDEPIWRIVNWTTVGGLGGIWCYYFFLSSPKPTR